MAEKINSWWSSDGQWFCIRVNDGVNQATVSLTHAEAERLRKDLAPSEAVRLEQIRGHMHACLVHFDHIQAAHDLAKPSFLHSQRDAKG